MLDQICSWHFSSSPTQKALLTLLIAFNCAIYIKISAAFNLHFENEFQGFFIASRASCDNFLSLAPLRNPELLMNHFKRLIGKGVIENDFRNILHHERDAGQKEINFRCFFR